MLLVAVALLASLPAPEKAKVQRVAVYEVTAPPELGARLADVVTASLVAEVRKLDGVSVIGMDEVRAMLDIEAQKQLLGCSDDSCLSEVAAALGADVVVVGSIARVGDGEVFGARRIDQSTASVTGQINQRLVPAGGEEFLGVVGPAVEALFPDHALKRGATRGVASEMAVLLNPPPLSPVVFWSGVGVTGLVAGGAGLVTALWQGSEGELSRLTSTGVVKVADFNAATQRADDLKTASIVAWSVAGAVGVVVGGSALFVDWRGASEPVHLESVQ